MASRPSSPLVAVTITLLAIASVGFFVASLVFLSKWQNAEEQLARLRQDSEEVFRPSERTPRIDAMITRARGQRQSLVGYLDQSLRTAMERVAGDPDLTTADLVARLEGGEGFPGVEGADARPLLGVLSERESRIRQLSERLDEAQRVAATAQSDLQAEVGRVSRIIEENQSTIAALNAQIDDYRAQVERYRTQVGETIATNNQRVAGFRTELTEERGRLEDRIARLEQENLILQGQLDSLRAERGDDLLRPTADYALVDGRVVSVNASERSAFIDLSRADRLVLGMSFEVYADPASIRPDEEGNYPRGKATVEVIRIGDDSSTVRILREARGNPIVAGDVLANAVYDPRKSYKFTVAGEFDLNRDGVAADFERRQVRALITNWGGEITEDLEGDSDFLVLGERPDLPPQPPVDAPVALINEYIRLQRAALEYDRLFDVAKQTGIPVLNQNRLLTLTGAGELR